jgi:hypothetical protein
MTFAGAEKYIFELVCCLARAFGGHSQYRSRGDCDENAVVQQFRYVDTELREGPQASSSTIPVNTFSNTNDSTYHRRRRHHYHQSHWVNLIHQASAPGFGLRINASQRSYARSAYYSTQSITAVSYPVCTVRIVKERLDARSIEHRRRELVRKRWWVLNARSTRLGRRLSWVLSSRGIDGAHRIDFGRILVSFVGV